MNALRIVALIAAFFLGVAAIFRGEKTRGSGIDKTPQKGKRIVKKLKPRWRRLSMKPSMPWKRAERSWRQHL